MLVSQFKRKQLGILGTPVTEMHQDEAESGFTCTAVNAISGTTFAVHSGTLPTGITFNSSSGLFSGTPTQSGTFADIVLKVTDGKSRVALLPAFTLTVTAVPTFTVANQAAEFGALTQAAAGDYQVVANNTIAAASITSGDASGHWQISSSGKITPTSAGVSAAFSGAPYSLGCSFTDPDAQEDTATITVTVAADTYSVATAAQFNTIWALGDATLNGKTIKCRAGSYTAPTAVATRQNIATLTNGLTIESHDQSNKAIFDRWYFNLSSGTSGNMTFNYLKFYSTWPWSFNNMILFNSNSQNVTFESCDFESTVEPGNDETFTLGTSRFTIGVSSLKTCDDLTIRNCTFYKLVNAIYWAGDGLTLYGNEMSYCWADFLRLPSQAGMSAINILVEFNTMHNFTADPNVVHPDFVQQWSGSAATTVTDVVIRGNVVFPGAEGPLMGPGPASPANQFCLFQAIGGNSYHRFTVEGNIFYGNAPAALQFQETNEGVSVIRRNTFIRYWNGGDVPENTYWTDYAVPKILVENSDANLTVSGNVCEQIDITAGSSTETNNYELGYSTNIATYTAVLQGTDFTPLTRADAIAQARPKVGSTLATSSIGALGTDSSTDYYDFTAGELN
jgi:hypothetical protein